MALRLVVEDAKSMLRQQQQEKIYKYLNDVLFLLRTNSNLTAELFRYI